MTESNFVLYVLISVLIMVIIALGFIWFLSHAQKKITESKLKEQEIKMSAQKDLLLNTVKTEEKERNRIAKELHDDVSSQLGIVNLNLHLLKKKIPKDEEILMIVDQMATSLKNSAERTRTISHELMPVIFKKFGLHHALNEIEQNINLSQQMKLSIEDAYLIKITDEFKLLHIYRIIQELINNTLKYAHAKNIRIVFSEDFNDIILTYTDDGVGFDTSKAHTGLGISNITTRVTLLEGEINIESSKGLGFKTTIKFLNHD